MRHKRKSPLSADFSFSEYSTSLNTCEDSADSPYVIQRAVMQAMDEEFYHKSHYYLPRRCRVRLYDRQGKVIHQSESVVLGARLPRIYMSASYRKTYCASFKVWELEVDRSCGTPSSGRQSRGDRLSRRAGLLFCLRTGDLVGRSDTRSGTPVAAPP